MVGGGLCCGDFYFLNFWLKVQLGDIVNVAFKKMEVLNVDLLFDCIFSLKGMKPP